MAWNQTLVLELVALSFFALFLYFSRTEPLRLKIADLQTKLLTAAGALTAAPQKMAADAQASAATVRRLENRCADSKVKHAHLLSWLNSGLSPLPPAVRCEEQSRD